MKPLVIQTENIPNECSEWLAERCDVHICPAESLRFEELLPEAKGLVVRTYTTVDANMVALAKNLQVIGRAGTGLDNIDLLACREQSIQVVHTPEANTESVVEFVITSLLNTIRTLQPITSSVSKTNWNILREQSVTHREFSELTLGIIGFGRIGSRLGRIAKSMGFTVVFCDLQQFDSNRTHGCTQVTLQELLTESDVISIHVDGRKENTHLCNSQFFSQVKDTVVFVNSSRGFVVDAYALSDFLKHNTEANAIIDVHDPEPIPPQYPLLHVSNVTLYPHIAAKTKRASVNMGWVVKDVYKVLLGESPRHPAS